MLKKLSSLILTFLFLTSCVEQIPIEDLENETFVDTSNNTLPIPAPRPTADNIPPKLLSFSPSGTQPSTTESVVLQIITDKKSSCRFDDSPKQYFQMFNILPSSDGGLTHLRSYNVVEGRDYKFYVLCRDDFENELSHQFVFSVSKKGVADITAPAITSVVPEGELASEVTFIDLVLTSNEASICKYSKSILDNYDQMAKLDSVDGITHTKKISPILDGDKIYFLCKDLVGNPSIKKQVAYTIKKEITPPAVNLEIAARQILSTACLNCHGAGAAFAGLDVSRDDILFNKDMKFIVAGSPDTSRIYLSLTGSGGVKQMPSSVLPIEQRDIIKNWIAGLSASAPTPTPTPVQPISCDQSEDAQTPLTRRLTKIEIQNSFEYLLGEKLGNESRLVRPNLDSVQDDSGSYFGITRNGENQGIHTNVSFKALFESFSSSIELAVSRKSINSFSCENLKNTELNNCLESKFFPLITRAWRRPISLEDKNKILGYFKQDSFANGMQDALSFVFLSPKFLFISYDDNIRPRLLNSFEIAERLAFLITARVPSQTLMNSALTKDLRVKANLVNEIREIFDIKNVTRKDDLRRSRAWSFFLELQNQWLGLKNLDKIKVENNSSFNKSELMWGTMFYLEEMFRKDRSIKQMFSDNFVVVANNIDGLYQQDFSKAVEADYDIYNKTTTRDMSFRKLVTSPSDRKGLLTQAAILAVNAGKLSTSAEVNPTNRGLWHADNIFCDLPGGIPADLKLEPNESLPANASLKEKMAAHTEKGGSCIGCHKIMDPVGFGLWGYDSAGISRDKDSEGHSVDPSGELEGQFFETSEQMIDIISNSQKVEQCVMSHLTSFVVTRDIDAKKSCVAQNILKQAKNENKGLMTILEEILTSDLFLKLK